MLPKINPTTTQAWKELALHLESHRGTHMRELFRLQDNRAQQMALTWKGFYLDYSKNRVSQHTMDLLIQLAGEVGLAEAIEAQFNGGQINETEGRSVGHTRLRDFENLPTEVGECLAKMKRFSEAVIGGEWKGYTGKSIQTIVNVGIGGSDLGPAMVCEALRFYRNHLKVKFVSNVDGDHVSEVLQTVDPETTLFIIVSKSFTTQETMTNAETIRQWFLSQGSITDIPSHFVAVSSNLEAVDQFGISAENVFPMWDWVGGRFSLWSAVGLTIACAIGYDHFESLLLGGHDMDVHFQTANWRENMPVIMALLSVWYTNFYGIESECVVAYSEYLSKLVPYLQQAFMESNGKQIDRNGARVNYQTGTIVWGSTGTNAQHAYFQLLHQGTKLIPVDFIAFRNSLYGRQDHHQKLLANCFAQAEALLKGSEEASSKFHTFEGNRPSNTLLIDQLTPKNLGSLIALYEHKIFVQGIIWNIYSYDQWGVELGKKLARGTLEHLQQNPAAQPLNTSTQALIKKVRE